MFRSPKPGSTTHPVRIDVPVELIHQIDAIGRNGNMTTRNQAVLFVLEKGAEALGHVHV